MPSEVLKNIARDFDKIQPMIDEAQELIDAAKQAGESTVEMERTLRELKIRADKWQGMLKAKGYL